MSVITTHGNVVGFIVHGKEPYIVAKFRYKWGLVVLDRLAPKAKAHARSACVGDELQSSFPLLFL